VSSLSNPKKILTQYLSPAKPKRRLYNLWVQGSIQMKIIALTDIHAQTNSIETLGDFLSSVDLILLVGDLTNAGGVLEAKAVIQTVRKFNTNLLAVPGNWDEAQVDAFLTEEDINLNCRSRLLGQIALMGAGASLPCLIPTPNEVSETDLELCLNQANSKLDPEIPKILVSHQPPLNTSTDLAQGKTHIGSQAVRDFIENVQPMICFTGHVHESVGVDWIGSTRIINPGPPWQGRFAYAELTASGIKTLEIASVPKTKP
jgi:Icc-related predicted phosphoesterase